MDNYFKNCPAVMSDGRHFTDWHTATRKNEYIKYINNIVRDDDYRMTLQCNANKFMNKEWEHYLKQMNCRENSCIHHYPTRTLPQYFKPEMQAFNNKMNNNIPKDLNSCPKYDDYRLFTPHAGLACNQLEEQNPNKPQYEQLKYPNGYDDYIPAYASAFPDNKPVETSVTTPIQLNTLATLLSNEVSNKSKDNSGDNSGEESGEELGEESGEESGDESGEESGDVSDDESGDEL